MSTQTFGAFAPAVFSFDSSFDVCVILRDVPRTWKVRMPDHTDWLAMWRQLAN